MSRIDSSSEIEEIQKHIEGLKKIISVGDSLARLEAMPDWKLLIMQGFCIDQMQHLLSWSIQTGITPEERASYLSEAQGPAYFLQFLKRIKDNTAQATVELRSAFELLEQIRSGGVA